jgi:hypothetical protein
VPRNNRNTPRAPRRKPQASRKPTLRTSAPRWKRRRDETRALREEIHQSPFRLPDTNGDR